MGFGGPVWHASVASHHSVGASPDRLLGIAAAVLTAVGDAHLGEWRELGDVAVHLRRRLTPAEAAVVGPVRDVRGTWEAQKRVARMERYLPPAWRGREE